MDIHACGSRPSRRAPADSFTGVVWQEPIVEAPDPARIRLTVDRTALRADGQDLSFVAVEVLDAAGLPHPNADHLVSFTLKGPAELAAVVSKMLAKSTTGNSGTP